MIATEYFAQENGNDFCATHTDAGLVTLCLAPEYGLQLYDKQRSQWVEVSGDNLMVFFFGDSMGSVTNYAAQALNHKVIRSSSNRFSIVFKLKISPEVVQIQIIDYYKQRMRTDTGKLKISINIF